MHIYIYIWVYICCKKKHAVMSWIKFFMLSLWGILGLTSVRDGVKAVEVLYELHVEIHPGMWKAKEVLMLAIAKLCKWSHKSRLVEWITTKSCYSTKGCTPCAVHLQEWPCGQLDGACKLGIQHPLFEGAAWPAGSWSLCHRSLPKS